jgi:hypothetical protein
MNRNSGALVAVIQELSRHRARTNAAGLMHRAVLGCSTAATGAPRVTARAPRLWRARAIEARPNGCGA